MYSTLPSLLPAKPNILDRLITFMTRWNIRGRARIISIVKQHQPYHLVRAISKHGVFLNLEPEDYMDGITLKTGYYEEEVLQAILQYLGEDGVLWDVGANVGLHAITAKHLRPSIRLVCFEPSPLTFARLFLNANLNNTDAALLNIGLGASSSFAKLSVMITGNSGMSTFKPIDDVSYHQSVVCPCETAADLIQRGVVPMPTVVKLDVESFELEVLSGFREFLRDKTLQAIVFESPVEAMDDPDRYPVFSLLKQAGFEIGPLASMNLAERSSQANYLAKRPGLEEFRPSQNRGSHE